MRRSSTNDLHWTFDLMVPKFQVEDPLLNTKLQEIGIDCQVESSFDTVRRPSACTCTLIIGDGMKWL